MILSILITLKCSHLSAAIANYAILQVTQLNLWNNYRIIGDSMGINKEY